MSEGFACAYHSVRAASQNCNLSPACGVLSQGGCACQRPCMTWRPRSSASSSSAPGPSRPPQTTDHCTGRGTGGCHTRPDDAKAQRAEHNSSPAWPSCSIRTLRRRPLAVATISPTEGAQRMGRGRTRTTRIKRATPRLRPSAATSCSHRPGATSPPASRRRCRRGRACRWLWARAGAGACPHILSILFILSSLLVFVLALPTFQLSPFTL